jgi:hypothetical protein
MQQDQMAIPGNVLSVNMLVGVEEVGGYVFSVA